MHVYRTIDSIQLASCACAIGMFDGVHLGHRMILESALREARFQGVPGVIFSFANHPQFLTSQTPTQLLSTLEERLDLFDSLGFDAALILDFTPELKEKTALEFIQSILIERLSVKSVTVGYDHRFGAGRQGDGTFLTTCGNEFGYDTQIIDPVRVDDQIVSSTLIRKLLSFGDLKQANRLLGRDYVVSGQVVEGVQRGRQLGFPTANLLMDPHRLVPGAGTYGGVGELQGELYPAVCNIGVSPTFGGQPERRVEVHLLGYEGPLFYGKTVTFSFRQRLRDEQKFASVEALVAQIRKDCAAVESEWSNGEETLPVKNR